MKPLLLALTFLTACATPYARDTFGWSQTFAEYCAAGDSSTLIDENGAEHNCPEGRP